ncbi:hypothetical protein [Microbacterium karelineae]|nr:hypothetical protein [Microbacterium karelineae]
MNTAPTFDEALAAAHAVYVREWFDAHPEALAAEAPAPKAVAA